MELHGVTGSPYSHSQTRRKMPAPFSRDSINVGSSRDKRSWKDTSVLDIETDDTVADFGVVVQISDVYTVEYEDGRAALTWGVRMRNALGEFRDYPGEQRVFAFTLDPA